MNRQFEPCNSPGVGRVGRTGRTLDSSQNGSVGHKGSRLAAWTSPDYVPDWSRTASFERFRAAAWSGPFERFEPGQTGESFKLDTLLTVIVITGPNVQNGSGGTVACPEIRLSLARSRAVL
uniref:Uncharacterized protein n=1 Tax=Branchiostoma floridae TaxID=7739 RepID=C3YN03_BRAFL|eukprot:XP_002602310.1 hypothetical protein BRAFLDRAFT_94324 [Branchiostoma floridae]